MKQNPPCLEAKASHLIENVCQSAECEVAQVENGIFWLQLCDGISCHGMLWQILWTAMFKDSIVKTENEKYGQVTIHVYRERCQKICTLVLHIQRSLFQKQYIELMIKKFRSGKLKTAFLYGTEGGRDHRDVSHHF